MNALNQAFKKLNHLIFDTSFKERFRRNPQDFSRNRCLNFSFTILSILDLTKKSLQIHLNATFASRNIKPITKQAFSLSRQKIAWEAFRALNESVIYNFYENAKIKLFKGKYQLLAIDGSAFILPNTEELANFFGKHRNQSSENIVGKVSVLYDVLNRIILDTRIASFKTSEKELALQHIEWLIKFRKTIKKKIILVFDRGYPSIGFFLLLKKLDIGFVCRAHGSIHQNTLKELSKNLEDRHLNFKPGPRPYQRKKVATWLRLLPKHDESYTCKLRCAKDGGFVLVTNLFSKMTFKHKDLKKIYAMRWRIETNYRTMKVDTLLENFSGKRLLVIFQEIQAAVLVQNLARVFEYDLFVRRRSLGIRLQPNHREALGVIKLVISQLYEKGLQVLKTLLAIIRPKWEKIRPNRSSPRKSRQSPAKRRLGRLCYA
jgi:hypothetical protein